APAEVGALIESALAEAKDHLFHTLTHDPANREGVSEGVSEEEKRALNGDVLHPDRCCTAAGKPLVTWADALTVLATRSLDAATTTGSDASAGSGGSGGAARRARSARYRVQVHLDTDGGWLTGRPRLRQPVVDGLTCDGTLTPVWETDGHPVNVGRSQRVVPHRTRVLVLDRDRGCRFPGCGTTRNLEIHHLQHWRDGGPTDTTNLLGLCPFHHDGHHRGEFTITGDPTRPDGLTFHTDTGLLIGPPHRPPRLTLAQDPDPKQRDRRRPPARLGRRYPAPSGGPLHLHLVDLPPT
ncbi:HNH endonuclease signature motif containing protein, partial [Terrabacter sp. Root181]|uniref:HNH endonuclease signature motif containing protein n=1 Tax=Terrabacter sp. Root181 TaxID=1736484 RepID=UPI0021018D74